MVDNKFLFACIFGADVCVRYVQFRSDIMADCSTENNIMCVIAFPTGSFCEIR